MEEQGTQPHCGKALFQLGNIFFIKIICTKLSIGVNFINFFFIADVLENKQECLSLTSLNRVIFEGYVRILN